MHLSVGLSLASGQDLLLQHTSLNYQRRRTYLPTPEIDVDVRIKADSQPCFTRNKIIDTFSGSVSEAPPSTVQRKFHF